MSYRFRSGVSKLEIWASSTQVQVLGLRSASVSNPHDSFHKNNTQLSGFGGAFCNGSITRSPRGTAAIEICTRCRRKTKENL